MNDAFDVDVECGEVGEAAVATKPSKACDEDERRCCYYGVFKWEIIRFD